MGRMSDNTTQRKALQQLESEPSEERIAYYRKPFMVLWAAIQEAASDVAEDYDLPADMPNYGWPNRCAKSPIHWSIGSRKKPWPMVPASPT